MQLKSDPHIFSGMQRDMSISKQKPESLYTAKNLRFTARNGDTMLSITNEKGTTELSTSEIIYGKYLGHCVVDNYVVVFTHKVDVSSDPDYIYKITNLADTTATVSCLYNGNLGFDINYPIETLGVYENDKIQKVYWTDGNKQPRYIFTGEYGEIQQKDSQHPNADYQFDFVATLDLQETVSVERIEGRGVFAPGTIQYAFCYYNKYGRQSNIFYTTLLHYISYPDRAGNPESTIANCFKITVDNLQIVDFDYLRVFSIHRTSNNAVPTVKKVMDIELDTLDSDKATFIDDGQLGDNVDPTELMYIGGEEILAQTMCTKDNTLFFGNLKLERPAIDSEYKEEICAIGKTDIEVLETISPEEFLKTYYLKKLDSSNEYYKYASTLNWSSPGFKNREHYRLGIQFQHKSGKWSEPIFIGDYTLEGTVNPSIDFEDENYPDTVTLSLPAIRLHVPLPDDEEFIENYIKARPVVVFPTIEDRLVLTQGLLCPTVFSKANRRNSSPFSQASWFFRPSLPQGPQCIPSRLPEISTGVYAPYRHLEPLSEAGTLSNGGQPTYKAVEIQGSYATIKQTIDDDTAIITPIDPPEDKQFYVDQSIVTMHSPDIEWDDSFAFLDYTDWKLRIVGAAIITAVCSDIDIQVSTPQNLDAKGFCRSKYNTSNQYLAGGMFISNLLWEDYLMSAETEDGKTTYSVYKTIPNGVSGSTELEGVKYNYLVYPWQSSGSLNNDENRGDSGTRTAVLKSKKLSNLKFFGRNIFFSYDNITSGQFDGTLDISQLQLFNSDQVTLTKIPLKNKSTKEFDLNYYGNVDTLLTGALTDIIVSSNEDISNCERLTQNNYVTNGSTTINTKKNNILYSASTPVRMKYKSGKHLVFGLTPNDDLSVNILPRVNTVPDDATGANTSRGNYGMSEMFWVDKSYYSDTEYDSAYNSIVHVDIYDDYRAMDVLRDIFPASSSTVLLSGGLDGTDPDSGPILCEVTIENGEYVARGVTAADSTIYMGTYYLHTGVEGPIRCFVADAQSEGEGESGNTMYLREIPIPDISGKDGDNTVYPTKINQQVIPFSDAGNVNNVFNAYLLLAELYRTWDGNDAEYPYFSGKTDEATKSNLWIPAGEPVLLTNADSNNKIAIEFTQGDTWYTRYDCLKTYPFTMEDENSIVEIGSFLCESRVNGDGRYDRNRGQISNLTMSPINFNLHNPVYNNKDNFFNYRILDRDYYDLNEFSNQITWSKEKQNAADVDLWTNITMANTFDLDGTMGKVNALRTWKDVIYCFQDNAISIISFNPRVQIPTSDGVPIEISNSYKLEGKTYISNSIGCSNKQTIAITPSGIYFIDPNSKELYNLAGNQLTSVSASHGFSNWFKNNELTNSFYDSNRNDLYVLNDTDCIVYSEIVGQFTSFMDYNATPAMFNINDKFFAFRNDLSDATSLYSLFTGNYNRFFKDYKPYYLEFISNQDSAVDKIFSTIDMRVDFRNCNTTNKDVIHNEFFDSIQVSNEYQNGSAALFPNLGPNRTDAKKKFRVWRVNIPRDNNRRLDRIRNTWCKIKFNKVPTANTNIKMELHDLSVQYFI